MKKLTRRPKRRSKVPLITTQVSPLKCVPSYELRSNAQTRLGFLQLESGRRLADTAIIWWSKVTRRSRNRSVRFLPYDSHALILSSRVVFAIQKCDPAPFYLFDEVIDYLFASSKCDVADDV